jgi:hypothetical protein
LSTDAVGPLWTEIQRVFFLFLLLVGLSTLVRKERVKERQPSNGGEGSNPHVGGSCRQSEPSGRREKEKRPSNGGEGSNPYMDSRCRQSELSGRWEKD